jgi:hypothetical protein
MAAADAASPQPNEARVRELLAAASIELSPRDELAGDGLRGLFPSGATVFVNHPPSAGYSAIVAACARLRKADFVPVPHIAARRLASMEDAVDFLRRVTGEADVDDVLLIGGDPDWPAGPFRDSLTLLIGGILECYGIERVRFRATPKDIRTSPPKRSTLPSTPNSHLPRSAGLRRRSSPSSALSRRPSSAGSPGSAHAASIARCGSVSLARHVS